MVTTLPRRRGWLATLGAVLVVGALVLHLGQSPGGQADDPGSSQTAESSSAVPEPDPTAPAETGRASGREAKRETTDDTASTPRVTGEPTRVVIPVLDVDAPVLPIRAAGGVLTPPSDAQELGWWADGASAGAARGSALVTGHTVNSGGGALDDLETLRRGELVKVRTAHGWVRYAVSEIEVYDKGSVARDAEELFSQEVPGRLVLVTCEDWDGERYLSNVVVTAEPRV